MKTEVYEEDSFLDQLRSNDSDTDNFRSSDLIIASSTPPSLNMTATFPWYQFDDFLGPDLFPPRNVCVSKDRLDSCVQNFKNYLADMVQHGRTPFISPQVYDNGLPPSLQDAYCICATYLSRTASNETLIFQIMSSKFDNLVSKRQQCYCSFEDELASVQAFIIYQVIRLFDGDIRQRGIAEANFQLLNTWVTQLRRRSQMEPTPSMQSSPYRNWLFVESVRRTAIMSLFLRAIYYCIKNGFCDVVPDMEGLPLTVRGELWEVKSEGEWIMATRGIQPDVLTYREFVEVWDGGSGGDVENFQKLLLLGCIGEEGLQSRFLESLTRAVGWT